MHHKPASNYKMYNIFVNKKVLDNTRGGKQLRMDTDKVVQDLNRRFP